VAPARIHPEFLDETCVLVEPGGTSWGEEKEWSSFFMVGIPLERHSPEISTVFDG
jgi:hypothetical protein